MSEAKENHCRFREEDNICAILRQTSSKLEKPLCNNQQGTTDTCQTAIDWRSPSINPIDLGLVPPMGEI